MSIGEKVVAKGFTKLKVQARKPIVGYELWCAIWNNQGRGQAMIGAPTLDELEERWMQITREPFDRERAQHCCIAAHAHTETEKWRA